VARTLYACAAAVDLTAFFLTQSRGAFFGLLAVIGTFTLYYAIFTKSTRARLGILASGAGLFGLYVLAYLFRASTFIVSNPILNRLTNLQATTETRLIAWDIAWKGFLERPLTGWGFDAFHILFNLKYNPRSLEFSYYETWFDRAHNTIMDTLAMTGIFGFLTYVAIFVTLFVVVWKARKKGWIDLPIAAVLTALPVGYFLQNLFVFDHPAAYSMSYLLFAFVIMATRPGFIDADDESVLVPEGGGRRKTHQAPFITFGIVQIIMLIVVWNYSILPFRASVTSIYANNYLNAGRIDEGFELIKRAGMIPTPYTDEQTFLLSRDLITLLQRGALTSNPRWREMYDYAKQINEHHLQYHPRDTHPLFVYARLVHSFLSLVPQEEQEQEIALAEDLYLRAIDTSPERQQLYFGLARLYSQMGRTDASYETLQKVVVFDENIGEAWWYLGLVSWLELGNEEDGTAALVKSMHVKAPYSLQNVSEALQLSQAAIIQEDDEVLKIVFSKLPQLSGGTIDGYLELARMMERAGLLEERNGILNGMLRLDKTLAPKFEALRTGEVETIDESLRRASDLLPGDEPVSVASGTQSEPAGSGPRR
jgi:tetratricopeptide (TPR) repeat protein